MDLYSLPDFVQSRIRSFYMAPNHWAGCELAQTSCQGKAAIDTFIQGLTPFTLDVDFDNILIDINRADDLMRWNLDYAERLCNIFVGLARDVGPHVTVWAEQEEWHHVDDFQGLVEDYDTLIFMCEPRVLYRFEDDFVDVQWSREKPMPGRTLY